ncbi:MAG: hypothetical protein CL565_04565 [Alphaproteobacteria bacterium]|nr:hypothetical protein [Alphaproteobacteria bacterium]
MALAYLTSVFIASFFTFTICNDGWASQNIGKQGACSSHGGVATKLNGIGIVIFLLSILYFLFFLKTKIYIPFKPPVSGETFLPTNATLNTIIERENKYVIFVVSRELENNLKERCSDEKILYTLTHKIYGDTILATFTFDNKKGFDKILPLL